MTTANKTKIKYDVNLLQQICDRDKCTVEFDKVEKYIRRYRITFTCHCGNSNEKEFKGMLNQGAFCKSCMKLVMVQRIKQTFLAKYGT